jgi:hypothetical protein
MGRIPHMWGQSLYILAMLVKEVMMLSTDVYKSIDHVSQGFPSSWRARSIE